MKAIVFLLITGIMFGFSHKDIGLTIAQLEAKYGANYTYEYENSMEKYSYDSKTYYIDANGKVSYMTNTHCFEDLTAEQIVSLNCQYLGESLNNIVSVEQGRSLWSFSVKNKKAVLSTAYENQYVFVESIFDTRETVKKMIDYLREQE